MSGAARSGKKLVNVAGTCPEINTPLTRGRSRRVPDTEANGRVYFIRCGDAIKIGYSVDPAKRLSSMQTGSVAPLELLADIPGTRQTEYDMHTRFGALAIRGEWFRDHPELQKFIQSVRVRRRVRVKKTWPTVGELLGYETGPQTGDRT